jgi:tetratricopeptide (TPR) repeat protein
MSVSNNPVVRAFGLTFALAGTAAAQAATKACEVNESRPGQVGRATLAVQIASSAGSPDAAKKQLVSAVKALTDNGDKMDNQVGRNFVLGKALVLWSMQPGIALVTPRGPLGYTASPTETIDLVAAIDSSFKVVEAANPECIVETARWRGQKPWIDLVNAGIERLNAGEVDSASTLANRAIQLNPHAPYGYVVLANAKQKGDKASEAFALYRKAVEAATRDTAYAEVRRQSLVNLGNLAADSAEIAQGEAAKKPYMDMARSAFEQVLQDKDPGEFGASARAGLCRVAIASGDTASLRQTYNAPLTNPATFSYGDLMNAGVCVARAEMIPEATKLFQAAYEKSPYHRDALSNLSIMLLRADRNEEALPLVNRLVSVEPNSPDNIQLQVLAYAGVAKRLRDARSGPRPTQASATKTKAGTKAAPAARPAAPRLSAAAADSLFRLEAAYADSAVKANERKDKLPYKVSLSEFSITEEKATVAGSLTNNGSAEKTVTVKIDFLDKDGKVVASKSASIGPIAAGKSSRFSVATTPGTGVAAFRYVIE